MKELAKTYDPKGIEDRLYQKWEDNKYFHAEVDRSKKPFTIVMPPPNITGQLHMGHALDNTMQDILIRYKRMQGYSALWQPGTDHAAIATEVKVINSLKDKGINKADLTRDEFLKYAWDWKEEYGGRIVKQLKKMGSSTCARFASVTSPIFNTTSASLSVMLTTTSENPFASSKISAAFSRSATSVI